MTTSSTHGSWLTVTDRLSRIRETLAEVGKALQDADISAVSNPLFLSLMDGAAECLEGAFRTLGGTSEGDAAGEQPAESGEAALRGHTGTLAIGEILGFLSTLQKSGTVSVRTEKEEFCLRLEEGNLVYATGDNNPVVLRLGEILVRQGALTEARFRQFLHCEHDGKSILGVALVEQGLVSEAALKNALAYQVQQIFQRLHAAPRADFEFREGHSRRRKGDLELNVTGLLLQAACTQDEGEHRGA